MNDSAGFWGAVVRIRIRDERFASEAYGFVMDSIESTLRTFAEPRHISATELLQGMCGFAQVVYGVMSCTLLENWGVHTTADIGDIVFHLVDEGLLSRRPEDHREDFDNVFDLRNVLETGYFDRAADQSGTA